MRFSHFCIALITVVALSTQPTNAQNAPLSTQARSAMNDLLRHFWTGDETTGHIVNTSHGYAENLHDPRGGLWERAMVIFALDNASQTLGDPSFARRIGADWQRTKSAFSSAELEACGAKSGTNWASDDVGWSALMYLTAHRVTGDPLALDRARGLVAHAFERWQDDQLGGGLWYSDERKSKSLYQTALVLAALRIFELTGDRSFHDRALRSYDWMEKYLLRADGLYWCNFGPNGPEGANRPDDIKETGSVVFLGGNMAMGVIHARLFRDTGEDKYRQRAIRTADALSAKLVTEKGVYLDDRDAWTNGTFAGDWAREVLTLPGIAEKHRTILQATAESIYKNARTADGFYGGSWSGPAEGPGSCWFSKEHNPSKPQQITTSANAVNMIVAGAGVLR